MALFRIGGYKWSPEVIGWGESDGDNKHGMFSYSARRGDGGKGKLTKAQLSSRKVNVCGVHAVYSLFNNESLVYIGEGMLGPRLAMHYRDDELVGRWNAFTWVSPWSLKISSTDTHRQWLAPPAKTPKKITPKELIEHVETIAIRLAAPNENRQNPSASNHITWLKQHIDEDFMTQEELVDASYDELKVVREELSGVRKELAAIKGMLKQRR